MKMTKNNVCKKRKVSCSTYVAYKLNLVWAQLLLKRLIDLKRFIFLVCAYTK